jgi:excisionase family DNA binding protein
MATKKTYLKSAEVAGLFGVNRTTISLWVKKGRLKPHKTLGGNFRFRRGDVERLFASRAASNFEAAGADRRREPRYAFNHPITVRIGETEPSPTYNATVRDISGHGIGLVVFDSPDFARKLSEENAGELRVLNLPGMLFREEVVGRVEHFEKVGDREIAVGVSLDPQPRPGAQPELEA